MTENEDIIAKVTINYNNQDIKDYAFGIFGTNIFFLFMLVIIIIFILNGMFFLLTPLPLQSMFTSNIVSTISFFFFFIVIVFPPILFLLYIAKKQFKTNRMLHDGHLIHFTKDHIKSSSKNGY